MRPTGGLALETLVRQATERYPTCGATPRILSVTIADRDGPERLFNTMHAAGLPFGPARERPAGSGRPDCEFGVLQSTALVTAVITALRDDAGPLDEERFWRHSAAVGLLAHMMSTPGTREADTAFPAGFCHALGRLLLARLSRDRFEGVLRLCRETGMEVNAAERQVLGVSEAELGSEMARRWGFPAWLADAIAQPRTQDSVPSDNRPSIAAVFPARLAAMSLGYTTEIEAERPPPPRLRWLIDPVLLRLQAQGGSEWLDARVDGLIAAAGSDADDSSAR